MWHRGEVIQVNEIGHSDVGANLSMRRDTIFRIASMTKPVTVAAAMACFRPEARERLMAKPLQQIWRDHLLAGALGLDREQGYAGGCFAFVSPRENARCASAVERYRACLTSNDSFVAWTLGQVVDAIEVEGAGPWIGEVGRRYLGRGRSEG